MPFSVERSYYRLTFPPRENPHFIVGEDVMTVVELSERGVRYVPAPAHAPEVGTLLEGTVRFRRGDAYDVTGVLSRRQGPTLVVVFDAPGLPYAAIMAEQRYLMHHYPARFHADPGPG
jgi:hypothetical protein